MKYEVAVSLENFRKENFTGKIVDYTMVDLWSCALLDIPEYFYSNHYDEDVKNMEDQFGEAWEESDGFKEYVFDICNNIDDYSLLNMSFNDLIDYVVDEATVYWE